LPDSIQKQGPPISPWQKLLRQRVIQTLALYIPIGWILNEIVIAASDNFALPGWVTTGALILFIAGIPVVAFVSWAFQWTESGVVADVKGWRGGIVVTIAVTLLFGVSTFLYLNLRKEALLENTGAITEPVAVIAVLPFEDQTGDDSSFGDIFSLEITDRLSKHPDLYVISSQSTFSPMLASLVPIKQQQQLDADHVISGVISRDEQSYVLEVSLLGNKQQILWKDDIRFGADAESQAGVQRRISEQVAELLGIKHKSTEYCEPSDNLEALKAYHAANLKINLRGRENLAEAESLLEKAISLDPEYGHAYSSLAIVYSYQRRWKPEYRGSGIVGEVARKALDRCPTLGRAYKIWVPAYSGVKNRFVEQELEWRDALAMNPNDIWMLDQYAFNLNPLGMDRVIKRVLERAKRLNPLHPRVLISEAWHQLVDQGNVEKAMELADEIERLGDGSCNLPNLRLHGGLRTSEEATITAWESFKATRCGGGGIRPQFESLGPVIVYQAQHEPAARRKLMDYMRQHLDKSPNLAMMSGIEHSDLNLAFDAIDYGLANDQYLHMPNWWAENDPTILFRRDPRFAKLVAELEFVDYWKAFGWPDGKCTPLGDSFICDN